MHDMKGRMIIDTMHRLCIPWAVLIIDETSPLVVRWLLSRHTSMPLPEADSRVYVTPGMHQYPFGIL